MKLNNIMRGADPELFLRHAVEKFPVTSIGRVGGSKSAPRELGGGFALQEDNVSVEFNIPPCATVGAFQDSISHMLNVIKQEMSAQELEIVIVPTMEFSPIDLDHPQARELGCEPDFNVYTMDYNPRPVAPETLRSAGGHIHLSWAEPNVEQAIDVVKAHDLFCGVPALAMDKDTRRRAIYGKAGACRFKLYGVEYRTLSNFWIATPDLVRWAYQQSEKAIAFLNGGGKIDKADEPLIQQCINESDFHLYEHLTEKYAVL